MSHVVSLKFKPTDLKILRKACENVGAVYTNDSTFVYYNGRVATGCEAVIRFNSLNVGVVKSGEGYTTVADTYKVVSEMDTFLNALANEYYVESAKEFAFDNGYSIEITDTQNGKEVVMIQW